MSDELAGLDLVGLLERLEPIPEPVPVPWWPQTEAWGWIAAALVVLAGWALRRGLQRRRANAYRRAALREIAAAGDAPAELAAILRRTALAAYPRSEVAGLHGDAWLAFLDESTGGGRAFREGPGRAFAVAAYAPDVDPSGLSPLARRWVRRHRVRRASTS